MNCGFELTENAAIVSADTAIIMQFKLERGFLGLLHL